ncbi:flippase-like domain-containing protein [Sphingosinithalassobacter sp. CS137]|uniref:flippase-like domain-containing protein n=1 Tax=Sphingosinithalassobacter sp. CS137 TaxID=2762748 RepID=UPI00165D6A94|nr:flippase-like domain-containing protein [Sphingosinithalassobacter sp. CS137]
MAETLSRKSAAPALRWLRAIAFLVGQAVLLAVTVAVAVKLATGVPGTLHPLMLLATILYLGSHLLRIARLALIIADPRCSLRVLTSFHFWAAAASLAIPFKLGDALRAGALAAVVGGTRHGVTFVWIERLFDAAIFMPLLLVVALLAPGSIGIFGGFLALTIVFVLASFGMLLLAPDNLRRAATFILRRYNSHASIAALHLIKTARSFLSEAVDKLRGRTPLLLAYSLFIWIAELAALWIVLLATSGGQDPVVALLAFFSSVVEGRTLPSSLDGGVARPFDLGVGYVLVTQLPLALCGLLASWHFGRWSLTAAGRRSAR